MKLSFCIDNYESWGGVLGHAVKALDDSNNTKVFCNYLYELKYNLEFINLIIDNLGLGANDLNFSSDNWGCDLFGQNFKIYFLLDEDNLDFTAYINKDVFLYTLRLWRVFLQIECHLGYSLDIVIPQSVASGSDAIK